MIAESKNQNGYLWGALGFFFWLIPLIIVIVLPHDNAAYQTVSRHRERLKDRKRDEAIIALARQSSPPVERFQCPECGESIPVAAKFCRFCNCILSDSDKANA